MYERLRKLQEARKDAKGFTLIELLIVIVILGVLAGIVVFSVNGITDRGAKAACKADVETVTTAGEAFIANSATGTPATDMDALVTAGLLHSKPTDVDYKVVSGTKTFTAVGNPAC
jgi:prepilin-type N-terminal cleavage/methylation domain-containing protein